MDLKGAVRDLRAQYGETQQRFADRLKISLRALANYEADREPTGRALYQLSRAAREIGRIDLADAFSDALAQELGASVDAMTDGEEAWAGAVVGLLRSRGAPDEWQNVVLAALEATIAAQRKDGRPGHSTHDLESRLVRAKYQLTGSAERTLSGLAEDRRRQTGESLEKAYSEVLLANPNLYKLYLAERAAAAKGTRFEKSLAVGGPRKAKK